MLHGVLSLLVYLGWTLVPLAVVYNFVRSWQRHGLIAAFGRLLSMRILLPLLLLMGLTLVKLSLVFVYPHQIGVVVSLLYPKTGIRPEPIKAGLHWVWPMAEKAVIYPIYWQTYTVANRPSESDTGTADAITARTLDSQEVTIDVTILFRVDPVKVVDLHVLWQDRFKKELLRPNLRAILRRQVSQYTVDEVNSNKRTELERKLDQDMKAIGQENSLIIQEVLLRNIAFTAEYAASVERKQVALQGQVTKQYEAQQITNLAQGKARQVTILAQAEADAVRIKAEANAAAHIIKAEAEKQALTLVADALQDRENLLAYRYIERLSPNVQAVVLPNDIPLIFPLPELQLPKP
jgi:regulator of protease activity HflC (stomatin/prohibitin superfamily)